MEKKNVKNALKVIFRGTILGVFFFIFSRHRGGVRGGFDKCQTFFFLKASLRLGSSFFFGFVWHLVGM